LFVDSDQQKTTTHTKQKKQKQQPKLITSLPHTHTQETMSSFNKPTSAADLAEFEALAGLTTTSLKPSGTSRWERKKAALTSSSSSNTPSKRSRTGMDSTTPSKIKLSSQSDRFIPNRSSMDMDNAFGAENDMSEQSDYQKMLEAELCGDSRDHRVLAFKNKAPVADQVSAPTNILSLSFSIVFNFLRSLCTFCHVRFFFL
jgi:hypothetical protein